MHLESKVVIVDLDGTLALNQHRYHYIYPEDGGKPNWDAFFLACVDDLPNIPVIQAVKSLKRAGHKIHIFSARGEIALQETKDWLDKHSIYYDFLTLRETGDYTPDEHLKYCWLMKFYPDYKKEILCVFDDRNKVVKMWRSLGLVCFQVADGDF